MHESLKTLDLCVNVALKNYFLVINAVNFLLQTQQVLTTEIYKLKQGLAVNMNDISSQRDMPYETRNGPSFYGL